MFPEASLRFRFFYWCGNISFIFLYVAVNPVLTDSYAQLIKCKHRESACTHLTDCLTQSELSSWTRGHRNFCSIYCLWGPLTCDLITAAVVDVDLKGSHSWSQCCRRNKARKKRFYWTTHYTHIHIQKLVRGPWHLITNSHSVYCIKLYISI